MPIFSKQGVILLLVILLPVQTVVAQARICPHNNMGTELPVQAMKLQDHACCKDTLADHPSNGDSCAWCVLFGSIGTLISAEYSTLPCVTDDAPQTESSCLELQLVTPLLKPPRLI